MEEEHEEILGKGTYGVIYKMYKDGKPYAIKNINILSSIKQLYNLYT